MICPNCHASLADDSNFCSRCGTPFRERGGFVANLWRDNKPGFVILALLLIAMLGSIGYYFYSRTGKFVVSVDRISKEEYYDLFAQKTLEVFCREFPADCLNRQKQDVEKDIRIALSKILRPVRTKDARITYKNNSNSPVVIEHFYYRTTPGSWRVENPQQYYSSKLQRLRSIIETANGQVPLETKVDYANTLALTENHGAITILPGEERTWRLGYDERSEFLVEYVLDGKRYRTPVLQPN